MPLLNFLQPPVRANKIIEHPYRGFKALFENKLAVSRFRFKLHVYKKQTTTMTLVGVSLQSEEVQS